MKGHFRSSHNAKSSMQAEPLCLLPSISAQQMYATQAKELPDP